MTSKLLGVRQSSDRISVADIYPADTDICRPPLVALFCPWQDPRHCHFTRDERDQLGCCRPNVLGELHLTRERKLPRRCHPLACVKFKGFRIPELILLAGFRILKYFCRISDVIYKRYIGFRLNLTQLCNGVHNAFLQNFVRI
jgi:hypothetical protein